MIYTYVQYTPHTRTPYTILYIGWIELRKKRLHMHEEIDRLQGVSEESIRERRVAREAEEERSVDCYYYQYNIVY